MRIAKAFLTAVFFVSVFRGVSPAEEIAAVVTASVGRVEYQKTGAKDWADVKKGHFLYEGDTVKTSASSKAAITFVNGIEVKMNENSSFKIELSKPAEKGKGNTVSMTGGQIWSKTMRRGSQFDIKTPAATVAIRGSSFDARIAGRTTIAKCYEGSGYLQNKHGRTDLKSGQKAQASAGRAPAPPVSMTDNDKETWQRDVKSKGSIKMSPESAASPRPGESFKLDISVVDESDELIEDFTGVISLSTNNKELSFSGDNQNWRERILFRLRSGKGVVYAKAEVSGVFMINAETSEDLSPSLLRVNVSAERTAAPVSDKTLKLDVRSQDGGIKQLEIKLKK